MKRYYINYEIAIVEPAGEWVKAEDILPLANLADTGLVILDKLKKTNNMEYMSSLEGILYQIQKELNSLHESKKG
jgi:hypothetical protein